MRAAGRAFAASTRRAPRTSRRVREMLQPCGQPVSARPRCQAKFYGCVIPHLSDVRFERSSLRVRTGQPVADECGYGVWYGMVRYGMVCMPF